MSITKEALHGFIDQIDASEYARLFDALLQFIPEDAPEEDELAAIMLANEQIARGEIYAENEIDWD